MSLSSPRRAGASALARLVDDTDSFASIWGRAHSLHHDAGFADLLDQADIDELLTSRGLRTPFLRVAKDGATMPERSFTAGGGVGAAVTDQLDDARLARLFADGATIVLQGLHRTWAPIGEFTRHLADELGHPVQANAYITPPQSRGFSAHYDVHDVFVLQLFGEKRWVIHEPVLTWPMRDEPWEGGGRRSLVADAAVGEPALEVTLRPGDCLYLPRGYLHAATALGGVSAHLTLGVHVWTRHHLASEMMRQALSQAADLRRPLALGMDIGDVDGVAEDIAAVRQALTDALTRLSDDDIAAAMSVRASGASRPEPVSPLAQAAAVREFTPDTPVRVRRHLALRRLPVNGGVRLLGRGVDIRVNEFLALGGVLDVLLDGGAHTACEAVACAAAAGAPGQFSARETPGSDHHVTDLVRSLLAAGVLVPGG